MPTPINELQKEHFERFERFPCDPARSIQPLSGSDKQLAKYRELTARPQLYHAYERERLALVIHRYVHGRLAEIRAKNKDHYRIRAALYLGHHDWSLLRLELGSPKGYAEPSPKQRAAGAVAILFDCPVYLVGADHHLNLCEVPL